VIVKGEFAIVSGLKWQADLSKTTSFLYKQETAEIVTKVLRRNYWLIAPFNFD
jgi:hypothetical protein